MRNILMYIPIIIIQRITFLRLLRIFMVQIQTQRTKPTMSQTQNSENSWLPNIIFLLQITIKFMRSWNMPSLNMNIY